MDYPSAATSHLTVSLLSSSHIGTRVLVTMPGLNLLIPLALCAGLYLLVHRIRQLGRPPKGLPPGPPTLPVLGNIHQLSLETGHKQMTEWAKEYGSMYTLMMGPNQPVIVVSDEQKIRDLLVKRGSNFSSRPDHYMAHNVLSGSLRVIFMKYSWHLKLARTLGRKVLAESVVKTTYLSYQYLESAALLQGLLEKPEDFMIHLQRFSLSFATQITYGFRTPTHDHPLVAKIFYHLQEFSRVSGTQTAHLLNMFPILRRLPDFFLPARKHAAKLHQDEKALLVGLYQDVERKLRSGTAEPCATSMFIEVQRKEQDQVSPDLMAYYSGSLLQAAAETTLATITGFTQAMVIFPDVAKTAQAEIDRVCGDRIPCIEDWKDLKYIRGCIKESLRWMPATILGVPHSADADDEYAGCRIPKHTAVIYNVWALHNDPKRYKDPRKFDPARWADDDSTSSESAANEVVNKRDHFGFGFGRRMCLAMNLVDQSLFLVISRLLWGLDFNRAVDPATGLEIVPDMEDLQFGLFVMPKPFPADIKPRSADRAQQIRDYWQQEAEKNLDGDLQWKAVPQTSPQVV
ncbi:hypothetical protein KVR01_006204 [Diaporthe batatas]|uniref:uncharacterized protein n=1 Tax=Diaporthe batatas TaxID=748121 RepID=UPI001D036502|nr:uncharacterized protein KVR01_006204 [Diaporthe batatas]KAG8164286.1 hypothetical protein KVR01_006204 [Diaporthe batatas]